MNALHLLILGRNDCEQHKDHVDVEFRRWLEVLLQVVDVTKPDLATSYFKLFTEGEESVLKSYSHVPKEFVSAPSKYV